MDGGGAAAVPIVGVAEVGLILAEVAFDAAGAGDRAGEGPVDGVVVADDADALEAFDKNAVAQEQGFDVEPGGRS